MLVGDAEPTEQPHNRCTSSKPNSVKPVVLLCKLKLHWVQIISGSLLPSTMANKSLHMFLSLMITDRRLICLHVQARSGELTTHNGYIRLQVVTVQALPEAW